MTNPILLRAALLLFGATIAFLIGFLVIRHLHKDLLAEGVLPSQNLASGEALPLHAYNAVIQQLKQQKQELTDQNSLDRRKIKENESLNAAILANISCGVVIVDGNGLVRQVNPAAREILGFASPIGLATKDILRGAQLHSKLHREVDTDGRPSDAAKQSEQSILNVLEPALAGQSEVRGVLLEYLTPGSESRVLELTVMPLAADAEGPLKAGVALVLTDKSDYARVLQADELQKDNALHIAASLRGPLSRISGSAKQLSTNRTPEAALKLADDISRDAAQLDEMVSVFLAGSKRSMSAAAGS